MGIYSAGWLGFADDAWAQDNATTSDCASSVSDEQGVAGYSTLLDGQPPDPNSPTLNVMTTRVHRQTTIIPSLQFTAGKGRGACDANLTVQFPSPQLGAGTNNFSKQVAFSWEQRWHADDGVHPTFATEIQETLDYSGSKTRASTMLTFTVAKTTSGKKMVLYGSGMMFIGKSSGYQHKWTPAGLIGIKLPARASKAIVFDMVFIRGEKPTWETSLQFNLPANISLGPGFSFQFGRKRNFTLGVGLQKLL